MEISVIIPVYNESGSLDELLKKTKQSLANFSYEIIAVNDASKDQSWEIIKKHGQNDSLVKCINFSRNCGQTAAIAAGIAVSTGDIIVPIDADLENNPADIPRLIAKLNEGYDVVSGWRQNRWRNQFLTRKIPSYLANKLIALLSGVKLSDFGCTLKAYRREVLDGLNLYGDMHRFIAAYAAWNYGARITEIPVSYTPRIYGKSNYGLSRIWKVILDLLTMKFLVGYSTRPIRLFGGVGLISILLGIGSGIAALYFRFSVTHHKDLIQTPLPVIMAMLIIVGIMLILMGLLAEIMMRTYHETQAKTTYRIKETINLP